MRFSSHAFAGTALGLLMAASSANAAGVSADTGRATAQTPIVVAQADVDNPDQKPNKKERRAERRAEKSNQAGGADQGGARQSQEAEQPKHQRRKAVEEQQPAGNAGQAQQNIRRAPASDEAPAMKPDRGKKRHSDEAGGAAAQGGNDSEQPAQQRKHRQQNESAQQPAAGQQTPEIGKGEAPDQGNGRKHRKHEENAGRGGDNGNGQAVQGKPEQLKPEQPKAQQPKAAETPKLEEKGAKQPQNAGEAATGEQKPGQTQQGKRHGKNAKGEQAGKGQAGESNTGTGEAAPKPEANPKQPAENTGNAEKMQTEQPGRNNDHGRKGEQRKNAEGQGNGGANGQNAQGQNGQNAPEKNAQEQKPGPTNGNAKNAEGEVTQGAKGQAAEGGQGAAEGGGNVVLPKSLNGQRAGEGRKRERRNAGEQNGNANNAVLPDSARGRQGQQQQAGRNGKAGPLPDSDAAAQADFKRPERIQSITAIEGRRVDKPDRVYREHPDNVKVVKEVDNRTIVEMNNQIFVRGSDRPRISHDARDVYYEDLPHSRTREVIERPDGSRVVTIRNEYGDVIRRSRILPDHREIVLVYVDDRDLDRDRDRGWGDAGADLPPLVVDVPEDDYVLDADNVRDPDRYYDFLEQPPVEPVRRLYSLGEVKRSARIRDIMPRIDLDTITFDFGSGKVGEDQADKLQAVANAIKKILDNNPAETFLIEGHTDAVGSPQANLVLSDERADSVASLLTSMFDIPAENLTTQGYGEEYLKVKTQEANRQNRRVTIRRITPLVAPVAQQ